jgi:arylsulfatase A-like enzyme
MRALLLAIAAACAGLGIFVGTASSPPLNLLVITLDTFRADRLGAYGSARGLTPHLDRFARSATVFETAESAAPLTLPSHCSLFTGQFPSSHGVHENADALSERGPATLAELLTRAGFRTAAFVSAGVLDPSRGLNRGFAIYDSSLARRDAYGRPVNRRRGDEIVARAAQWLDRIGDERFFAWVHFYDAHAPYQPPVQDRGPLRHPYDGAIAFIDRQVGDLLTVLDRRGLAERTVVVIVGDHGESLGDHGEATHGLFLYESVLHVPLMIRAPNAGLGRRVRGVTRTIDVMPTVLELLDVPGSGGHIEGDSLLPFIAGAPRDAEAYAENLYPSSQFGWSSIRSLQQGRFKLVATARSELYDLERDPGERQNLFGVRRDLSARMLERLRRYDRLARPAADTTAIDAQLRERLGALGYVSGGLPPSSGARDQSGADPKDMVDVFNELSSPRAWRDSTEPNSTTWVASEVRP